MSSHEVTALILAGGRSQRMGQDKLWLALAGVPLIARVVQRVLPVAGEILFSANAPERFAALISELDGQGVPAQVVADQFAGAGPLAGLQVGLSAARHDLVLAVAADMPFVELALIRWMIGLAPGYDAVIPQWPHPATGHLAWEPLHALYRRRCLPAIATRLTAGERRVQSFLPDVQVRVVSPAEVARFDPEGRSFFNVNTPEDWQRAQSS